MQEVQGVQGMHEQGEQEVQRVQEVQELHCLVLVTINLVDDNREFEVEPYFEVLYPL